MTCLAEGEGRSSCRKTKNDQSNGDKVQEIVVNELDHSVELFAEVANQDIRSHAHHQDIMVIS